MHHYSSRKCHCLPLIRMMPSKHSWEDLALVASNMHELYLSIGHFPKKGEGRDATIEQRESKDRIGKSALLWAL